MRVRIETYKPQFVGFALEIHGGKNWKMSKSNKLEEPLGSKATMVGSLECKLDRWAGKSHGVILPLILLWLRTAKTNTTP